jgi:ferrous iron transport protein B
MTLKDLNIGEKGIITKVKGRGSFRKRIIEMGFIKGKEITVTRKAPLSDPIEYQIMGYSVSLRQSEAELIEVVTSNESIISGLPYNGVIGTAKLKKEVVKKSKTIDIVMVGNPNSGKTSLFNFASGSREHVGNYAGVTVDSKTTIFKHKGYIFNITDLPGTYSLTAFSPEEIFVRNYITTHMPDIVVNVIDSSNLERNLYLTTQLIDMDIKIVIALNMFDELLKKKDEFNYDLLGKMIGIPFIPTVGSKGKGIKNLLDTIINVYEDSDNTIRHIHINYGKEVEESINKIQEVLRLDKALTDKVSSRFFSIKLIEKDKEIEQKLKTSNYYDKIIEVAKKEIKRLEIIFNEDTETVIANARYGFISGALKETYKQKIIVSDEKTLTQKIDSVLTHKYFGFPIFIFFIWLMFQATFSLGKYPMEWLDMFVSFTGDTLKNILPSSILTDLLIDGIINGVGGVLVFLPNILILFLFISIMEDTGYMARTAFIMDKLMHIIGLHGKSFIPLIMGFGCNVPAIMATRTLNNRTDRLLTILILPFMSCSARLPVYILIAGAVFPKYASHVIFSIYLFGILLSILVALIFKNTIFRNAEAPFVMELPPYRIPTLRSVVRHIWFKASLYLKKMGGVILIASIIIWLLGYFPLNINYSKNYDAEINTYKTQLDKLIISKDANGNLNDSIKNIYKEKINELKLLKESERQQKSYIGKLGKLIEPVIRPLGFDWRMGISLISGAAAKEIVISTMGVLFHTSLSDENTGMLKEKLRNVTYQSGKKIGKPIFTPVTAYAFLLFVLIYLPCIGVISAVSREAGHWKWSLFLISYTTFIAWVVAFLVQSIGSLIF